MERKGIKMSYREKSAWVMAGTLIVAYGWYLTQVLGQLGGGAVTNIDYQGVALVAGIAVVALAAALHIILAATGSTRSADRTTGVAAIKRYARSAGAAVIAGAAVVAMVLSMIEADHFWIANVILAGLVLAELTASGSEILVYRRRT
jgi:hypothetical protein